MTDIANRLRRWTHAVDAAPASDLMDEAADEIARLRLAIRRLAEQDATLSVCNGSVTVEIDGTLTDAEREAVREAAGCYIAECDELQAAGIVVEPKRLAVRDTLAALLVRLGGGE